MPENTKDLARPNGVDKVALEWLARAIPVPVNCIDFDGEANARYWLERDEIEILPEGHPQWDTDIPWTMVLAHEGAHATQYRLGRTPALDDLALWRIFDYHMYSRAMAKEEAVAYLATVILSERLGYDPKPARERYEQTLDGAPIEIYALVKKEADAAVAWLEKHATEVDKRPFDDDLKRLVDGTSPQA
jgi:antirestriction protein ArdC